MFYFKLVMTGNLVSMALTSPTITKIQSWAVLVFSSVLKPECQNFKGLYLVVISNLYFLT